jgi:hypothetical protein
MIPLLFQKFLPSVKVRILCEGSRKNIPGDKNNGFSGRMEEAIGALGFQGL